MLKVGLVGVGGISGAHIPAWDKMPDVQLVALCDIRSERMESYKNKHCYLDFDEMLEKENLDILDICLPTYMHVDFACKAMDRGINVISEKPVSLKSEDVDRVYNCAQKNHVTFMVAQVLRFWPEYELLKYIYDSKKYGHLLSGSVERLGSMPKWSWDNWMSDEKRSGLVPYDLHVHDLDFLVYTFGNPESYISNRIKKEDQDSFHVVYRFKDFSVSADAAWYNVDYPFTATYRFVFEKGVVENGRDGLTIYELDGKVIKPMDEESEKGDTGNINLPKSDAYANEIRYFTDCVKANKNADKIKPEELKSVINILNNIK